MQRAGVKFLDAKDGIGLKKVFQTGKDLFLKYVMGRDEFENTDNQHT